MLNKTNIVESLNYIFTKISPEKLIESACTFKDDILKINGNEVYIPKDKKVTILGSGKAVQSMASAICDILKDKIKKVILVGPYESKLDIENLTYLESTHPLPSQKSINAAQKIIQELECLKDDEIFIYLLSGGNSALVELPSVGISLSDFQSATAIMLQASMPIEAINCVRKHISLVKGGGLSKYTKSQGHIIVLSDVLGDSYEDIGSAPFYYDRTTFEDAFNYLKKYKIFNDLPLSIKEQIINGMNKLLPDTLKFESEYIKHYLIGSNSMLLKNVEDELMKYDITPEVYNNSINEDVDLVCESLLEVCSKEEKGCFIFGGEATVLVKGEGKGGRNQHLVLKFLSKFPKDKDILFLSVASDGIDGNSSAAGAVIDKNSLKEAEKLGLNIEDYLQRFDSNSFFKKTNSLIEPGPTHNNMLDAVIIYIQ